MRMPRASQFDPQPLTLRGNGCRAIYFPCATLFLHSRSRARSPRRQHTSKPNRRIRGRKGNKKRTRKEQEKKERTSRVEMQYRDGGCVRMP
ncbi:hypothetical protein LX36DRAFT_343138 [Colletotrichum falcatum]|nr:hypothetical protein LX36DRAFT_343138 [Colletotrichum falcatum]